MRLLRIISGGQTGADRAGLDAAIALDIPHGGWCPRGRRAEDGVISDRYRLQETDSPEYEVRTSMNVEDSDGTVLFTRGAPTGGSLYTAQIAEDLGKPMLHLDVDSVTAAPCSAARELNLWILERAVRVLNVAGSRESQCPGIEAAVTRFLEYALRSTE